MPVELPRRVGILMLAIAIVLCTGTTGYVLIEGYPWFDALYMAATTMTTVGYMEIHPLSPAGRVFNLCYLLASVSLLLVTIGVMTQAAVENQFGNVIGRRRAKKMIEKVSDHYIVCGFGRVGRGAAAELKNGGSRVVVVDRREDRVEWALKLGYLAMAGDSTHDDTLREAGVARASGMVAALATDADNLFAVISAKSLNPQIRVAARAAEDDAERKMRQVGADEVLAPYRMTGVRLAQALLKPHVFQFLDFATSSLGMEVYIEQLTVGAESGLADKTLAELNVRRDLKVIVLAIRRAGGEMVFNPGAEARIEAGDSLVVMGEQEQLRGLEKRVMEGRK
ncbi:MAG TPA: potassium channel protein [Bryobacteraceae bacterium]|nr:potassium channel protein [Bryobacteraceae bacterium]